MSSQPTSRSVESISWWFPVVWLVSFLTILSQNRHFSTKVCLLDARSDLAWPELQLWHVPLTRLCDISPLTNVPGLTASLFCSILIALWGLWLIPRLSAPIAIIAIWAISSCMNVDQLIPAGLIVSWTIGRQIFKSNPQQAILSFLIIIAAIFSTIEFGVIIAMILIQLLISRQTDRWNRTDLGLFLVILIVVGIGTTVDGFWSTLLRPLNWYLYPQTLNLIPSTAHSLSSDFWSLSQISTLLLLFGVTAYLVMLSPYQGLVSLFLFLGLCCQHYLILALFCLCAFVTQAIPLNRWKHVTPRLAGILPIALVCYYGLTLFLSTNPSAILIEPEKWPSKGTVLLTDLDNSQYWQSTIRQRRFRLLLDDRWEVCGPHYQQYAALCQDVSEVRASGYLRSDLSWGGYKRILNRDDISLIEIHSDHLVAIRRMSLSPHWKLMGFDANNTYFGRDDRRNQPQIQRAYGLITHLEWPQGQLENLPENTIPFNDSMTDALQISEVLCALRLPYASIRYLPNEPIPTDFIALRQRAWCLLEVAHRVNRYTGRHSLLDQYRAIQLMRYSIDHEPWEPDEIDRAGLCMLELDASTFAEELFDLSNSSLTFSSKPKNGKHLTLLDTLDPTEQVDAYLRERFIQGDQTAAQEFINQLPIERKAFYQFIIDAPFRSALDLHIDLKLLLEKNFISPDLLGEAYFYLGSLAIEAGDTQAANAALLQAINYADSVAYHDLCHFYLAQLNR